MASRLCVGTKVTGACAFGTVGDYPLTFKAHNTQTPDATQTFTLHVVKTEQPNDLAITPTSGTAATPLALSTTGGAGTGASTFAVLSAGTANCSLVGSTLSATAAPGRTVTTCVPLVTPDAAAVIVFWPARVSR